MLLIIVYILHENSRNYVKIEQNKTVINYIIMNTLNAE